jgi:hypothetical protein
MIKVILPLLTAIGILGGCAQVRVELGSVQNGRDLFPSVSPEQASSGDFSGLTQGEALVFAEGSDSLSLSSPEPVVLSFYRVEEPERREDGTVEETERFVLSSLKFIKGQGGNWVKADSLEIKDGLPNNRSVQFKLIAFNSGSKTFNGNLKILDRLDGELAFSTMTKQSKIKDNRGDKAILSVIPYAGIIALAIDDFSEIPANYKFSNRSSKGLMRLDFEGVSLAPGEGLSVEFSASLDLSRFTQ